MIESLAARQVPVTSARNIIRLKPAVSLNTIMHSIGEREFSSTRKEFLRMQPAMQTEVIGQYSRSMLRKADKLIGDSRIPMAPDAVSIWNATLATKGTLSAKTITEVFPNLKPVSGGIAAILQDTYRFWVDEVYSCGNGGQMTVETAKASAALKFTPKRMDSISRESGLSGLGEMMKAFAHLQVELSIERLHIPKTGAQITLDSILDSVALKHLGAVRAQFCKLPFNAQAKLIGEYAKLKLAEADRKIAWATKFDDGRPSALEVWNKMLEIKGNMSDDSRIADAFPQLAGISENLADIFGSCYRFWVNRFYSCDEKGQVGTTSAQFSPSIKFGDENLALIDRESGMPKLGANMKGYSRFLFMTGD